MGYNVRVLGMSNICDRNFVVEPNAPLAGPDRMLKFWPIRNSNRKYRKIVNVFQNASHTYACIVSFTYKEKYCCCVYDLLFACKKRDG